MTRAFSLIAFLLGLSTVHGCGGGGGKTADIKGKVFLGDKQVVIGVVTFFDKENKPYTAYLGEGGDYHVKGFPIGEAKLTVVSRDPANKPKEGRKDLAKGDKGKTGKPGTDRGSGKEMNPPDPRWIPLPREYSDPTTPLLNYSVKEGDNHFDIKLTDPPTKQKG